VYAQYQETEQSTDQGYTVTTPGTKYLVADVGGKIFDRFLNLWFLNNVSINKTKVLLSLT